MTVILGCTVWIPLLLWISALVQWMIGGEIEPVNGILGIFVGIALGVATFHPPFPAAQGLAYATVWLTLALFPFVRAELNQRELRSVDVLALEKAYLVVGQRPRETFGRFRLALAAWNLGMTGHAMRIAETCLPDMDPKTFREEHMIVARWRREAPPASAFVDYECMECGGTCPPGKTHCPSCGAPFLLERVQGKAFAKGAGGRIVASWVAGVGALAGVAWAITLPPAAAIGTIIVVLGLAFLVVFLAFRPPQVAS